MHLSQIEAYRAVLVHGTTQAAARELGISQPAVSRRISQLEESLGVTLFIRQNSRLIATRESGMLQDHLCRLGDQARRTRRLSAEIRSGNSSTGTLRIAVPSSLTLSILPAILAEYLTTHDRTRVELHTGPYDAIERMLLDDRAEIGFIRLPAQSQNLDVRPLVEVRTVCVLPIGHPLAAREVISIDDLAGIPLILLGRQRAARTDIDTAFFEAGVRPVIRVEAHSVCTACAMVAAGTGVTLVNELMARDYAHMPVAVRPLRQKLLHRFAFATASNVPPTQAAEDFIALCADRLADVLSKKTEEDTN